MNQLEQNESLEASVSMIPNLNESQRQELEIRFETAMSDFDLLKSKILELRTNFPNEYEAIRSTYPQFGRLITDIETTLNTQISSLSNEDLIEKINLYNHDVLRLNNIMKNIENPEELDIAHTTMNLLDTSQYIGVANRMSEQEIRELHNYANELMEQIFPESFVSRTTRIVSGEYNDNFNYETGEYGELENWQRIAIAPAEGIENIVRGIAGLANPQTYTEIYNGLQTVYNLSREDLNNIFTMIEILWNDTSTTDKVAKLISIVYSLVFLTQLVTTIPNIPNSLRYIFDGATTLSINNKLLRALPLASIGGLAVKYINYDDVLNES